MQTDDWLDFFPSTAEGIRADQEKAVNFIGAKLKEGATNIFFEGPPGVGKSFIAWTLAMYFAVEFGWKSRILVPNRFLENQYIKDFAALGLRQLHSARHYTCPEFVSCDIGRGSEVVAPIEEVAAASAETTATSEGGSVVTTVAAPAAALVTRCEQKDDCVYLSARNAFAGAPIGVTNIAYALTCARYGHQFVASDLLFIDEGHKLNDEICALYRIVVPFDLVDSVPAEGAELLWATNVYLPNLHARIESATETLRRRMARCPKDPVIQRLTRDIEHLNAAISNLNFLTATNPEEWAITRSRHNVTFQPLWARRMGPRLLGFLAPRRVFMSATFLDFEHHLDCLG